MALIHTCSPDQIAAQRTAFVDGIATRINCERALKGHGKPLEDITNNLTRHRNAILKLDSMTFAYIHHNPLIKHVTDDESVTISFADIYTSQRRGNQFFNVYAIPKTLVVARCLNGGVFYDKGNDDETLAGVILAMSRGMTQGKVIKNYLCDYMNRDGAGRGAWQSQDTQGSSSLRALEALGVVSRVDGKGTIWQIASKERFARLVDAANGIAYVPPPVLSDEDMTLCDMLAAAVAESEAEFNAAVNAAISPMEAPASVPLMITHDVVSVDAGNVGMGNYASVVSLPAASTKRAKRVPKKAA